MSQFPSLPGQYTDALRQLADARNAQTDVLFLKFSKQGEWTYGAEDIVIGVTDELLVDPTSFTVGIIGWKNGQVVDEIMVPLGDKPPLIADQEPIVSQKEDDGWKNQLGVQFRIEDVEIPLSFKSTSKGGTDFIGSLADVIVKHDGNAAPVVRLTVDSYRHKRYGKINKPMFDVIRWEGGDGGDDVPQHNDRPPLV